MVNTMVLKEALDRAVDILKSANVITPAADAGVIICHVIKKDRAFIYAHDDYLLQDIEKELFFSSIYERANGKPVQYITGHQEFMSLDFKVNPDVLIPRQDTEVLVETVIESVRQQHGANRVEILEIGTGSGCIAVSLAYYIKDSIVTAVDISEEALETARSNAARNGVPDRITFIKSDIFRGLEKKEFDIIVSNPPYIPSHEIKKLQVEVKDHEPLAALDGKVDGLFFFKNITAGCRGYLKPGGLLAFEVGYDQARKVADIMEGIIGDVRIISDLSGIERVVTGSLIP